MYVVGVNGGSRDTSTGGLSTVPAGALSGGVYMWAPFVDTAGNFGWGIAQAINSVHTLGQRAGRYFVPLPFGVVALQTPAAIAEYAGRLYIAGGYSYNTVLDEHHRMWKQGIRPPEEAPNISGAAGTTVFGYLSWYDELTDERSPLSLGVEIGTGTPRTWNSLPTRPPDDVYVGNDSAQLDGASVNGNHGRRFTYNSGSRLFTLKTGDRIHVSATLASPVFGIVAWPDVVEDNSSVSVGANSALVLPTTRPTHLELWLSFAGDLPRLAMRVPIGVTTVVESKGIADLGEAFFAQFQRFPRCTVNAIYHDRQLMAGDPENPDTLYVSELFYPERFAGKQFRTRDGKPITGILATRDYALVFTRSSTYQLQGYTDQDLRLNQIDQNLGSIGHNCNTIIHGDPFVWTEKGPYMFNGQWHPLSPENRWKPVANVVSIPLDMVATDDPYFNTYIVSSAQLASERIFSPYNGTVDEPFGSVFGDTAGQGEGIASDIVFDDRRFAVLDYTLVQPEAGGAFAPARLSFDSLVRADPQLPQFMKYLRNNWGQGALYHIGSFDGSMSSADADGQGTPAEVSFAIIPMQIASETQMPARFIFPVESKIITHFDMLQDLGAYSMESKQFKKLWFHMRAKTASAAPGTAGFWKIMVFTAPDAGWWNHRLALLPRFDVPPLPLGPNSNFHARASMYEIFSSYVNNPDMPLGDIVQAPVPDYLSGRGLWLYVRGFGLQFHGFGGAFIWGADTEVYVDTTPV